MDDSRFRGLGCELDNSTMVLNLIATVAKVKKIKSQEVEAGRFSSWEGLLPCRRTMSPAAGELKLTRIHISVNKLKFKEEKKGPVR